MLCFYTYYGNGTLRKKNMYPKVTIGIPTYNRQVYLKDAVESVIAQDYPNIEIIVSDNHSTDSTEEYIQNLISENPEINIVYNRMSENLGAAENWSYCWNHATGEYFLMLSDDDTLLPDAVTAMVNSFSDDIVSVVGNVVQIDANGVELGRFINPEGVYTAKEFWKLRLGKKAHDTPSSLMYRLENVKNEIVYEAFSLGSTGDIAMNMIMIHNHKIALIGDFTTCYRVHSENDSLNVKRCVQGHVNLYNFFLHEDYNEECLKILFKYCKNVIWSYIWLSLQRQYDSNQTSECMNLLSQNFYRSRFSFAAAFCFYIVKNAVKGVIKKMILWMKKKK